MSGEPAVHLLERMLAFDPDRRLSAEEALTHEYFTSLENSAIDELGTSLTSPSVAVLKSYCDGSSSYPHRSIAWGIYNGQSCLDAPSLLQGEAADAKQL